MLSLVCTSTCADHMTSEGGMVPGLVVDFGKSTNIWMQGHNSRIRNIWQDFYLESLKTEVFLGGRQDKDLKNMLNCLQKVIFPLVST